MRKCLTLSFKCLDAAGHRENSPLVFKILIPRKSSKSSCAREEIFCLLRRTVSDKSDNHGVISPHFNPPTVHVRLETTPMRGSVFVLGKEVEWRFCHILPEAKTSSDGSSSSFYPGFSRDSGGQTRTLYHKPRVWFISMFIEVFWYFHGLVNPEASYRTCWDSGWARWNSKTGASRKCKSCDSSSITPEFSTQLLCVCGELETTPFRLYLTFFGRW